jgi:hypothetical protein
MISQQSYIGGRSLVQKLTWPAVALAAVAAAFLFGIFVFIPDDAPEMRTALLGLVILGGQTIFGYLSTKAGHEVTARVDALEKTVRNTDPGGN